MRYLPYLDTEAASGTCQYCRILLRNNNSLAALFEYEASFDTCSMSRYGSICL